MAADYDMSLYDNEFWAQVESVREDYSRHTKQCWVV